MMRLCTLASLLVCSSATVVSTQAVPTYTLSKDLVSLVQSGIQVLRRDNQLPDKDDGLKEVQEDAKSATHELFLEINNKLVVFHQMFQSYTKSVEEVWAGQEKSLTVVDDKIEEAHLSHDKCRMCPAVKSTRESLWRLMKHWQRLVDGVDEITHEVSESLTSIEPLIKMKLNVHAYMLKKMNLDDDLYQLKYLFEEFERITRKLRWVQWNEDDYSVSSALVKLNIDKTFKKIEEKMKMTFLVDWFQIMSDRLTELTGLVLVKDDAAEIENSLAVLRADAKDVSDAFGDGLMTYLARLNARLTKIKRETAKISVSNDLVH